VPMDILEAERNGKTHEQLALLFGVSTEVIGYRLKLLDA
jgi:hypothetical protein